MHCPKVGLEHAWSIKVVRLDGHQPETASRVRPAGAWCVAAPGQGLNVFAVATDHHPIAASRSVTGQ
jgi:shikimate kinase